jgi:hypothetical protein
MVEAIINDHSVTRLQNNNQGRELIFKLISHPVSEVILWSCTVGVMASWFSDKVRFSEETPEN